MEGLLADFNTFTGSNMTWTIMDFEEDNGTSGYKDASGMPAVFPYASDQTMTLSQFGALANVPNSDVDWIIDNMGDNVRKAASLNKVVGYPFAADNQFNSAKFRHGKLNLSVYGIRTATYTYDNGEP